MPVDFSIFGKKIKLRQSRDSNLRCLGAGIRYVSLVQWLRADLKYRE